MQILTNKFGASLERDGLTDAEAMALMLTLTLKLAKDIGLTVEDIKGALDDGSKEMEDE